MDLGLSGRVAFVAAASKGIGFACARAMRAEGARVVIGARDPNALARAAEQLGPDVHAFPLDVADEDSIVDWLESGRAALGAPDILLTNTGGPPAGPWPEKTDAEWQAGVDSTLMSVVRMVRHVAPAMQERGWGRIVHVTSLVAKEPSPLLPISATLRSGLMALTRLQATELAPFGVTVNGVLPGHTLTDRQRHLAEVRAERGGITPDEALALQAAEVPMKRLADPAEIAAAVVFLASAPASYITGVSLLVDGGLVRGLG